MIKLKLFSESRPANPTHHDHSVDFAPSINVEIPEMMEILEAIGTDSESRALTGNPEDVKRMKRIKKISTQLQSIIERSINRKHIELAEMAVEIIRNKFKIDYFN